MTALRLLNPAVEALAVEEWRHSRPTPVGGDDDPAAIGVRRCIHVRARVGKRAARSAGSERAPAPTDASAAGDASVARLRRHLRFQRCPRYRRLRPRYRRRRRCPPLPLPAVPPLPPSPILPSVLGYPPGPTVPPLRLRCRWHVRTSLSRSAAEIGSIRSACHEQRFVLILTRAQRGLLLADLARLPAAPGGPLLPRARRAGAGADLVRAAAVVARWLR
jgi:hypothetical protein